VASADVEDVRDWVGATPDDDAVQAQLTRFADETHTVQRAALAILRRREIEQAEAVEAFGVDGDYNERRNVVAALTVTRNRIARLERITGDTAGGGLPPLASAPICGPGGR
jgi:hypothetical protein